MPITERLSKILPEKVKHRVEPYFEAIDIMGEIRDPRVMNSLGPSAVRGLLFRRGKQGVPTKVQANHQAHFDWTYPADNAEMRDLYRRAQQGPWDGEPSGDWSIDVDPRTPE
ncbi:MAG: hypothetical protein AAGF12_36510, partial [Myxococcota bacterium]